VAVNLHPTAIVEPGATLGQGVRVGPYCLVGAGVTLGDGVELLSHAVVVGATEIGARTRIFPFASIGHEPQDRKFAGEASRLVIGPDCTLREHVTVNPGTQGGGLWTRIGARCLLMAGAHVAHDCQVGDDVVLVNQATLGGHVEVGDFAIVGGLAAVHQFVRIGRHAMVGGMSGVERDVIPFGSVLGDRAHLVGLNLVGLKRRGFHRDAINELRHAYRLLFAPEGTLAERLDDVARLFAANDEVGRMVAFIRQASQRGICQPKPDSGEAD